MTRSDIIELVNQYTERKAEKIFDMNLLFASTCQDICKRGRHWWRKWDVTFNLTPGVTTYDLTAAANFTPNLTDVAVEEIVSIILILQNGSPTQQQTAELTPIFDKHGITSMKNNTQTGQPSRYTIDPNTWFSLRVDPPDATYLAEMNFWVMPNLAKETVSDTVPIIPPFYHNIIVEGMEARVDKRVYGANDSRYIDAKESYEQSILTMMMRAQFTPNYTRQWVDDSSARDGTGGNAVQSTSPHSP
jgi:hypothetical protein